MLFNKMLSTREISRDITTAVRQNNDVKTCHSSFRNTILKYTNLNLPNMFLFMCIEVNFYGLNIQRNLFMILVLINIYIFQSGGRG